MTDKYKKLRLLGEGSHAKVHLVEDESGSQFALKEFLLGSDEEYDEMQSRFLVEKTVLTNVQSDNVIRLIDTVEIGLELSIVMEICQHGSLRSQLKDIGPFSLERTIMSGLSILDGLESIHSAGYIHRDLKPDNILQGEQGILKIADMGLAKGTDYENKYCQGTVAYMSPEQHTSYNNVDERSDIYSVGATLYHLYTGKELFKGDSIEDILDSHKNCIIPSLKDSRPECPLTFNYVIRKMIAKKPADRYKDAEEARLDLEAVLAGVEGIDGLPSIQNVKELADTLTDVDIPLLNFSGNRQKKFLLMAVVLILCLSSVLFVLPSKTKEIKKAETLPVESPEVQLAVEVEPAVTDEFSLVSVADNVSEQENSEDDKLEAGTVEDEIIALEKQPLAAVAVPPVKKNQFTYLGPLLKNFGVVLDEVSDDLLSCKITVQGKLTHEYSYGEKNRVLKVISIKPDHVVVLRNDQKAYRLNLNEKYLFFDGRHRLVVNGKKVIMSLQKPYKNFKIIKTEMGAVTLVGEEQPEVELNAVEPLRSYIKAISLEQKAELLGQSAGGVLEFMEFKHKVFPIILTGVAGDKIQIKNGEGKKSVHKKSEIVLGRLQIVKIEGDTAEFRDIRTSKSYVLYKNQTFVLQKGALYSYMGELHRVMGGQYFFGYKAVFDDLKVSFKVKEQPGVTFGFDKSRIFLPELIGQSTSQHTLTNCSCLD